MLTARQLSRREPMRVPDPQINGTCGDRVLLLKLKRLRMQYGLTQAQVVGVQGARMGPSTLANIEAGRQGITVEQLVWFARFYEVSLDELCDHIHPTE